MQYALNAYNPNTMITTIITIPFRMVYIYLSEGVTQASRTRSDTILPIGYIIDFTNNIIPPPDKRKVVSEQQYNKTQNKLSTSMHKY